MVLTFDCDFILNFYSNLSGNRDAKKSRLRNSLLSANIVKSQAAKTQTFIPVYTSVPIKPWIPEEVLQSSALKNFKFNDLNLATRMFHPESIIGQGGFGHVYKGWIDQNTFAAAKWGTGLVIAVKRLSPEAAQGHHEWLVNISFFQTYSSFPFTFVSQRNSYWNFK